MALFLTLLEYTPKIKDKPYHEDPHSDAAPLIPQLLLFCSSHSYSLFISLFLIWKVDDHKASQTNNRQRRDRVLILTRVLECIFDVMDHIICAVTLTAVHQIAAGGKNQVVKSQSSSIHL